MENKNIFFCLRLIFCISLIGIWVLWLSLISEDKKNISTKNYHLSTLKNKDVQKETVIHETPVQPKKITQTKKETINLPRLEDLLPITESQKTVSIKQPSNDNTAKSNPNKITIPEDEPPVNTTTKKLSLRKKVYVNKSQHKLILKKIIDAKKDNSSDIQTIESWLPRLSQESEGTQPNKNNNDNIAKQIELLGLIPLPNGATSAILKNKTNNTIEILKKGDNIQELKVLEINTDEVLLLNEITKETLTLKSH